MDDVMASSECDVLIVGAGPTGLLLAGELLAAGVCCRIVDQNPEPVRTIRALTLQPRTLGQLASCGLLDELMQAGQALVGTQVHLGDEVQTSPVDAPSSSLPLMLSVPQPEVERILTDKVRRCGGEVERGLRLIEIAQEEEGGVAATLRYHTGQKTIRARWIVGCDGRDSTVRRLSGITSEVSGTGWYFLLIDATLAEAALPRDHVSVFLGEEGFVLCIPVPGPEQLWRIVIDQRFPFTGPDQATIQDHLTRRGMPGRIQHLYLRHHFDAWQRCAASLQAGSIFLAGDAAHWLVPVWGQGMNTGMQDALNLSWRLTLVSQGMADKSLLDLYTQERLPIAQARLKTNQLALSLATLKGNKSRSLRNKMLPSLRNLDAILFRLSSSPHQYPPNRLIDQVSQDEEPVPFSAGGRAPELPLQHRRHLLLLFADSLKSQDTLSQLQLTLRQRHRAGLEVRLLGPEARDLPDTSPVFQQLGVATGSSACLIRPDGYIACRSQPADPAYIEGFMKRLFSEVEPHA
jgi:2-polyprenyl-6-methoxyphenol hydroxylase-like FAD-dependent oxidoreductase